MHGSNYIFASLIIVAWAQVKGGEGYIQAVFETQFGDISAGWVMAKEGCWSMLKGGIVVNVSGPANLVFEVIFMIIKPIVNIFVAHI